MLTRSPRPWPLRTAMYFFSTHHENVTLLRIHVNSFSSFFSMGVSSLGARLLVLWENLIH